VSGQAVTTHVVADLESLSNEEMSYWRGLPANQQPDWATSPDLVAHKLSKLPGIVCGEDVDSLRELLALVAAGNAHVIQVGDCAEDPVHCVPEYLRPKLALMESLAAGLRSATGKPVVRVGRIAGQFAKPRSRAYEWVNGRRIPVFRGHLVNAPDADPLLRRADPERMLSCYQAALAAAEYLRACSPGPGADSVWTSHEALVLDYEVPLTRLCADRRLLTSTHWPWVGDRTRQPGGAHVRLLSALANPVACKVGPTMTVPDLLKVCELLDPEREPGRLTLIARMGAGTVAERLPLLVRAVRTRGYPVSWLCDPMHGNTLTTPGGRKTRTVTAITQEVREFCSAVRTAKGVAGGLHLEATAEPVRECVWHPSEIDTHDGRAYTTLCDPRLDIAQARAVVRAWQPD
jgi:3-deoxy-7-phosphoheptulonate synthase